MNYLDIIILIPFGFAVFRGLRKGLILELAVLVSLFVGIFAGIYFSDFIAGLLIRNLGMNEVYTKAVAFTLIFIAVIVLVRMIAKAIESMIDMTALSLVNKTLGVVFSVLKIALLLSVIFFIINRYDPREALITHQAKEKSFMYKPVCGIAPLAIPRINSEIEKWRAQKDSIPQKENQQD
ncbi:MAG TPA: CvpA family protein [Bacteroidales bacterium]|nr:CvpA family protein [Bacteroidales bacterium]